MEGSECSFRDGCPNIEIGLLYLLSDSLLIRWYIVER